MESVFACQKVLPRVFFLSGLSSLLFQVAFQRLLTLHYGVGPVSVALIVSLYMFGLGAGGFIGGLVADRSRRPLLAYALVEVALASFGALSLTYLDLVARHTAGGPLWLSLLAMCAVLSLPTIAMGMTLPLVVKLFNKQAQDLLSSVSYLYAVNTLGAATGALTAAFLTISFLGLDWTIYTGAAIDLILVALICMSLRLSGQPPAQETGQEGETAPAAGDQSLLGALAYPAVFVTGMLGIGYEIVWFRLLTVLVKSSPYAYATTLAVYLFGIALGSYLMSAALARRPHCDRRSLFFMLQVAVALSSMSIVACFYHFSGNLIRPLVAMSYTGEGIPGFLARAPFLFLLCWPVLFVLLPTILMGASFPLITYLSCTRPDRDGQAVGTTYFFNTAGNVCGALLTGLVLLPWLGTEVTLSLFTAVGLAMLPFVRLLPFGIPSTLPTLLVKIGLSALLIVVSAALLPGAGKLYLAIHDMGVPPQARAQWHDSLHEGMAGVVVVHAAPPSNYQVVINGLGHGRRPDYKYYREAVEALSYGQRMEDVLVIGFGGGSTVETIERIPSVGRITIVEINDALIANLERIDFFRRIMADARVRLVVEDCRRFLLSTGESYDMILLDPLRSTEAYSNNIYSRQFFELTRAHLRQPGILLVWLDEHRVLPKTIATVFPYVRVYNYFCLASLAPFARNEKIERQLLSTFSQGERDAIAAYKTEYLGDREYALAAAAGCPVNEDMRPVTEYYLGLLGQRLGSAQVGGR